MVTNKKKIIKQKGLLIKISYAQMKQLVIVFFKIVFT